MIALIALLFIVATLGFAGAWLGEHPGQVVLTWHGYQLETSAAVLVLFSILAAMLGTFIYNIFKRIYASPRRIGERRELKHYRQGLLEITHSVAALASADMDDAMRHAKKAERALGVTPLTLLLRAQISKNAGSDEESRELLEQLLEHKETEYLAAKSLADVAKKQERLPQALQLAERAHKVAPRQPGAAWALFDLHLQAGHFQEAQQQANEARARGAFSRAEFKTAKGRIALKQAENSLANGHKENALAFSQQAVVLLPGHLQAAELCADLYAQLNQPAKALKIIEEQWKHEASDALAALFLELTEDEKPKKREKHLEKLKASNPGAAANITLEQTL